MVFRRGKSIAAALSSAPCIDSAGLMPTTTLTLPSHFWMSDANTRVMLPSWDCA
jgi:hypothetical protein